MFHKVDKLNGNEKIYIGENASAILQQKLPPKCADLEVLKLNGQDKLGVAVNKHLEPGNKATRLLKDYQYEKEVMK